MSGTQRGSIYAKGLKYSYYYFALKWEVLARFYFLILNDGICLSFHTWLQKTKNKMMTHCLRTMDDCNISKFCLLVLLDWTTLDSSNTHEHMNIHLWTCSYCNNILTSPPKGMNEIKTNVVNDTPINHGPLKKNINSIKKTRMIHISTK